MGVVNLQINSPAAYATIANMGNKIGKIEDLGYDLCFESDRTRLEADGFLLARVIAEYKGAYKIKNTNGEYLAEITGKQMFSATSREDFPAVGDWVAITQADSEHAVIHQVLTRKTMLKRKYSGRNETQIIAANIDVAFIIESVDRDFNLNRLERYFAIANDGGVQPAIVLNKIDLLSQVELDEKLSEIRNRFGDMVVILTSTLTNEGLDALKKHIAQGKTYCFLGSSGVGKSSLINKLLGESSIKTGHIGERSNRGRHITAKREMYFLSNGGIVIDNPGLREVGMTDASAGIDSLFDEITALGGRCIYVDCTHTHEPGCAVRAELEAGRLDAGKYANYINLKKEAEHYEMSEFEKKEKRRRFGKFIKNAKKDLRNFGHKGF